MVRQKRKDEVIYRFLLQHFSYQNLIIEVLNRYFILHLQKKKEITPMIEYNSLLLQMVCNKVINSFSKV